MRHSGTEIISTQHELIIIARSHVGYITFECMYVIVSGGEEKRERDRERKREERQYMKHIGLQ